VGQPRDRDPRAAYALWDAEAGQVEIRRVGYDVATARRKIVTAGLPRFLADRLAAGA
jgi:diadenosine tetraphosphatase ApaH/serine/threonine PP2A family protein phosphatase